MAASRFTEDVRRELLERFAGGLSVAEASRAVGVNEKTLKGWLTRGRAGVEPYAPFVAEVDEAREAAAARPTAMSEEEHRLAVSQAARKGSVQALKLYWEMIRAERDPVDADAPADPLAELDELAARRAARA